MAGNDPIDLSRLGDALEQDAIRLEPLAGHHRAALRAICAEDDRIWEMYAVSYDPEHFDASFDALRANPARMPYAIIIDGAVGGMTAWINADPRHRSVEIGNTYFAPRHRGTGVNGRVKQLMLAHGFAQGLLRIQFTVDTRNQRSQAACLKMGAVREGVMRNHYVTWTGYLRDSALFSIVARDWQAR